MAVGKGKRKREGTQYALVVPSTSKIVGAILVSIISAAFLTHLFASSPIHPTAFSLPDPPQLESNTKLSSAIHLLEDAVYGAECIAEDKTTGKIYAGLRTGLICEIRIDKTNKMAKIVRAVRLTNSTDCDGSYGSFPKCGRPLGLSLRSLSLTRLTVQTSRFSPSGSLLVADAYLGLFEIDLKKEKVLTLVRGGSPIDGSPESPPLRYINDVDTLPDGRIVMSESSHRFDDRDFIFDVLEHRPNGRLLVYDIKTDTLREMMTSLYFPNGILVSRGKILVAEMGMARILRVSPSSEDVTILADNLPGYPDNIRKSADERSILVAIPTLRGQWDNWMSERPNLRELFTKFFSNQAVRFLTSLFTPDYGLVLKLSTETGEILESLHDPSGTVVSQVSTVIERADGSLLMGSDNGYYLALLPAG